VSARYAEYRQMSLTGATATVSTLATVVGHPNTPTSAGNGILKVGLQQKKKKGFRGLEKGRLLALH